MIKHNAPLHYLGSLVRTLLGATFIFSGFVKAVDPLGTVYKIEDYLKAFGGFFTDLMPLAFVAALAMIAFEFVLGCCLLTNVWTRVTRWLTLAFMLVMTPLTLYLALTNPVSDCGCFGDALILTNWQTFYKNLVLLALSVALCFLSPFVTRTWKTWLSITLFALPLVAVLVFMTWTLLNLPVMDFRPYKVGAHIPTLMEIPDDAPQDEYEITFTYEKDGVEKTFTLDNYPKGDTTWHFVDQQSVLVKKGFEPLIHDFELMTVDDDMEDVTYDLLEAEEEVVLCVMYDLKKAGKRKAEKLQELQAEEESKGRRFYCVTGSGEQEIMMFREMYGEELPFLTCDPVTLKTIVRANPGVVVLREGTILEKYHF